MKTLQSSCLALALCIVWTQAVLAHHSAAVFDFAKPLQTSGVVKDIRVINPHMSLTLQITDAKGTRPVDFEGHSVNNFYRAGWRPNMVKIGDKITVTFAGRKDGMDGGFVTGFVTESGQEIAFKPPSGMPVAPEPSKAGSKP